MIAELRPRSHREYLELPLIGPLLDEFVRWSSGRGYTPGQVKNQLKDSRHIVAFLQGCGYEEPDQLTPASFADAWEHFRHSRPDIAGTVRRLAAYLTESGWLPAAASVPVVEVPPVLYRFASYLDDVRGLAPSTIASHCRYLARFLRSIDFETGEGPLRSIEIRAVESFVAECSKTLNRYSLQHLVGYLRSFLRFLYSEGELSCALHGKLDTPRLYRQEKLPHALPWGTVNCLLNAIDRTDNQGIRNYAMFLLMATYGLRSCEVVSLKLDNIHWRSKEIRVCQTKNDNVLVLPLTDGVANSLIDYLSNARPPLPHREVFLRVRAPLGVLKPTAVTEAFQREVRQSGLDIPYQGPHCLRHSYAVHLLRQGNSLKTIGDILGHRSAESTCVYLRLAQEDLRCVALEPPESSRVEIQVDQVDLDALPRTKIVGRRCAGPLRTFLSEDITTYLRLHRSLGKAYAREERILHSLDAFLAENETEAGTLDGEHFARWSATFARHSPCDRRSRMLVVRKFCLYRQRANPDVFVPDPQTFPQARSQLHPFILSNSSIGRLLEGARHLISTTSSPLRPEVIRLAILLLFTTGLRRGELLRLTVADFDPTASTLFVGPSKFHKERILPLSAGTAENLRAFLDIRRQRGLPLDGSSALVWNFSRGPAGRAYTGTALRCNWRVLCTALRILTPQGLPPRIHDIRHSFAVNALLRWYREGDDLMARLPRLSTYMGHVSIASTQHYLHFIEPLRTAAGARFEEAYGRLADRQESPADSTKPDWE